jgi:hypothetical protein
MLAVLSLPAESFLFSFFNHLFFDLCGAGPIVAVYIPLCLQMPCLMLALAFLWHRSD